MEKEKLKFCVYFHINPLKNEVFYVGIGDKNRPKEKDSRNTFWYNVVKKYSYIVDIVHINLSWIEACKLEQFYIKFIGRRDLGKGSLVNLTDGGEGAYGRIHSLETKNKMSSSHKGIKHLDSAKLKISIFNKGKKQSIETINKRIKASIGKVRSIESKINISNSLKGKVRSEESKLKQSKSRKGIGNKPILQYDLNGNFIKEWESSSIVKLHLGITNHIAACCKGKRKTAGGYKWKYK